MIDVSPQLLPTLFRVAEPLDFDATPISLLFSIAHIVSQPLSRGCLETQPSVRDQASGLLHRLITHFEKEKDRREHLMLSDMGVSIYERDLVDFVLPLILSKNLACVTLGSFIWSLFYFYVPVPPEPPADG